MNNKIKPHIQDSTFLANDFKATNEVTIVQSNLPASNIIDRTCYPFKGVPNSFTVAIFRVKPKIKQ